MSPVNSPTHRTPTTHRFVVPTVTCTRTNGCACTPTTPRTTRNLCSTSPTTRVGRGGFVTA